MQNQTVSFKERTNVGGYANVCSCRFQSLLQMHLFVEAYKTLIVYCRKQNPRRPYFKIRFGSQGGLNVKWPQRLMCCVQILGLQLVPMFWKLWHLQELEILKEVGCWGQAFRFYHLVPLLVHFLLPDYRHNVISNPVLLEPGAFCCHDAPLNCHSK